MKKTNTGKKCVKRVVGIDLSDQSFMYQELDRDGEVIGSGGGKLTRESVREFLRQRPKGTLVAFEAGGQSGWVRDEVVAAGHEAIVADPRQIPEVTKKRRRTDEVDAANLAHYAWLNPASLHPVQLRPSRQQAALAVIRLRAAMVEGRTMLINSMRGLVKLSGDRVAKCDADRFAERAMEQLPAELSATFLPTIQTIRHMTLQIAEYDKVIEEMADRDYPESRYLWQVPGVGKLTALDFVLTIGSPDRVARSRDVGPLLGLVPARRQSGEQDPHLGISKTGDRYLRKLLVQCAQRILGKRGADSALRQWGLLHAGRTRPMKKRAVVAVARKLAVMLHRLWARQEAYRPFPSMDEPPAEARCVA